MYSAIYLPSMPIDIPSPDKHGFSSLVEAQNWIIENGLCNRCKKEREQALKNPDDETLSATPPCYFEWIAVESEKLNTCGTLSDLFDAAGFQQIFPKDSKND